MIQGLSESDYIYGPNNSRFPKLRLGNLDASRDWGHAKDYVRAMWMMLQHDTADDYVVSTEETYSVRDFLNTAFYEAGIDDWENLVVVDPKFYRPAEVPYLCGVSQKIRKTLGWSPEVTFEQLAKEMVEADING